jgi:hypothetical protein
LVTVDIREFSFDESIEEIFLTLKYNSGRHTNDADDEIRRKIQSSREALNRDSIKTSSNYLNSTDSRRSSMFSDSFSSRKVKFCKLSL